MVNIATSAKPSQPEHGPTISTANRSLPMICWPQFVKTTGVNRVEDRGYEPERQVYSEFTGGRGPGAPKRGLQGKSQRCRYRSVNPHRAGSPEEITPNIPWKKCSSGKEESTYACRKPDHGV